MAENWTVVHVGDALGSDGQAWEAHARRPDGSVYAHIFPKTIFEIRAAEYGIAAEDIDTLLDVVLHEPHIPDPTDERNHAGDAARLLGHVLVGGAPVHLFNAGSIGEARRAHLARVEACKKDRVRISGPATAIAGGDPLDVIRTSYRPDRARVAAIAEHVDQARRAHQRPRALQGTTPPDPDWSA